MIYPKAESNEPADVLRQAANIIEKYGWTQFKLTDGRKVCTVGSIYAAVTGNASRYPEEYSAVEAVNKAKKCMEKQVGTYALGIGYNDDPARTITQVIADLREAADRCETGIA